MAMAMALQLKLCCYVLLPGPLLQPLLHKLFDASQQSTQRRGDYTTSAAHKATPHCHVGGSRVVHKI